MDIQKHFHPTNLTYDAQKGLLWRKQSPSFVRATIVDRIFYLRPDPKYGRRTQHRDSPHDHVDAKAAGQDRD
ncbi:MAG: hypothetical protein M0Z85_12745 [Gammaproteobacteria bacterium]|nr:hypothetical protein [Gammaproteobacteria bacterium]